MADPLIDDRPKNIVLARSMRVQRRFRNSEPVGDVLHGRFGVTFLVKKRRRGTQYRIAVSDMRHAAWAAARTRLNAMGRSDDLLRLKRHNRAPGDFHFALVVHNLE